jgi:hypothetical protein
MNLKRLSWAVGSSPFLACMACSSPSPSSGSTGSGTVTGTVGGASLVVGDSLSVVTPESPPALTPVAVQVGLATFGGACADLAAGGSPPASGAVLVLAVQTGAAAGKTFAIDGFTTSAFYGAQYGTKCNTFTTANTSVMSKFAVLQSATAGSIKLDTITSTMVGGSFDVTFPSGDNLTGKFTAPACANTIQGGGC